LAKKENSLTIGAAALKKHDTKVTLKSLLKEGADVVIEYMKNLSPSGVELEILMLGTFEFNNEVDSPSECVSC
jgi:hypothetical protein